MRDGAARAAMVPLENSVGGSVPTTIDELATGRPLVIEAELHLPVAFALLARPGTTLDRRAHRRRAPAGAPAVPWLAARARCRRPTPWRRRRTPTPLGWSPTGAGTRPSRPGPPQQVYGLDVLADDVHDVPGAETRFVLVTRPQAPGPATGSDKTSLVLVIGQDHPGALLEILTEFAVRGINLTRIESRPTGGGIGDYFFAVDAEGHIDEARVGEALIGLHRICADVRYLGSYPRADAVRPSLRRGVSDAEYGQAQAWLARVRDGRA